MSTDSDLSELLQFLYMCPVGIIEFDNSGSVTRVNPQAANLCAAIGGYVDLDQFLPFLERFAPDLVDLVADVDQPAGTLVKDHRLTIPSPEPQISTLSLTMVRVTPSRVMAVLQNETPAVALASLAGALAPLLSEFEVAGAVVDSALALFAAHRVSLSWSLGPGQWREASGDADSPATVSDLRHVWEQGDPLRDAVRSAVPVIAHTRPEIERRYPDWEDMISDPAVQCFVAVPLITDGLVGAVLRLDFTEHPPLDADFVDRMRIVSGLAVASLERSRLHDIVVQHGQWNELLAESLAARNSELSAAVDQIAAGEARYRALVEHGEDAVTIETPEGMLRYVSPGFTRITGLTPDAAVGTNLLDIIHEQDRLGVRAILEGAEAHATEVTTGVCRIRHRDARWHHVEITASNQLDEPSVCGIVTNLHDITAQVEAAQHLAHRALHDDLTGLPNRALILDRLKQALARAERAQQLCAALFVDLDLFKQVNDTLGHSAGDQVLVTVATRLSRAVRPSDSVARIGGDEFVVVVENIDDPRYTLDVAERIRAAILQPIMVENRSLTVGCSIGIALTDRQDPEALLQEADMALYRAKSNGRNRWEIYDQAMRLQAAQRLEAEDLIRTAIADDGVAVYYQPIIDLATGLTTSTEALVRLRRPDGTVIGPDQFITVAEDSGLINALGRDVLTQACNQQAAWGHTRADLRYVAVNVSARQLSDHGFLDIISSALEASGLDGGKLCLELTESTLIDVGSSAQQSLHSVKDLGVRLAIDDFGTGWSSLAYLRRFPIDIVKIDRSFVAGMGDNDDDTEVVRAVIDLSKALRLTTIAEGVETPLQARLLKGLGCDYAQGFLYGRPEPPV